MQTELFNDNHSGAVFSECRKHRYALWRIWDKKKPLVMFIGLNPSKADEKKPDPTITRVKTFAEDWGYGGFYMMNLFSFVSENPNSLLNCMDPVKDNDLWLSDVSLLCEKVIFCWGAFKQINGRDEIVMKMFKHADALIINKNGSPRHPLYVPGSVKPIGFL